MSEAEARYAADAVSSVEGSRTVFKDFLGEFRPAAELLARGRSFTTVEIAFQSQGIGTGMEWLGPDLQATFKGLSESGTKSVLIAPIGFLADHVEILYDLDIEAKAWAESLGMTLYRSASLNDGPGIVHALATVVGRMTS